VALSTLFRLPIHSTFLLAVFKATIHHRFLGGMIAPARFLRVRCMQASLLQRRILYALQSPRPSYKYRLVGSDATHIRCCFSTTTSTRLHDDANGETKSGSKDDDFSSLTITSSVKTQIRSRILQHDKNQLDLALRLDQLRTALSVTDAGAICAANLSLDMFSDAPPKGLVARARAFARKATKQHWTKTPRGIYIHGSVGVGKSFLMDLFVASMKKADVSIERRKIRRCHFHEFMLDVHERIHQQKKQHPKKDPLPSVAMSLAQEARILCLDEFQVTDIADAMILQRIFRMLWMDTSHHHRKDIGMVVVATSNRGPNDLYDGGLNRSLFVPFITTLQRHMDVVEMSGNKDYRRDTGIKHTNTEIHSKSCYWPVDSDDTRYALQKIFAASGKDRSASAVLLDTALPVRMGRLVHIPKATSNCAWIDFMALCGAPLGAADYLAICERFPVLIVDKVPQLNASRFNEARRFVILIDAVYESKTRLVLASEVPVEELLVQFEATVESNDGDEEISVAGIVHDGNRPETIEEEQMFVKREGGSSSSAATTMVRNKEGVIVEWSATGRTGVSLAQLSAVRDVSFSFQRAESRLVEMNNGVWGRSY
jgi:peroxisome-assembly ATPase